MRAIFCGNFDFEARQSDLERLFRKYGKVDRVDMKSGFAFVYMEDERDAEDAIRGLDRRDFGRKGRRLRVEWTKQERGSTRRFEDSRKPPANLKPTKTLFVINFDPYHTRTSDLEKHFDPYGKIVNIRIRKNFAFIQYESLEDAIKALEATNMSKLFDRVITVEYAIKNDDERNRDRDRDRDRERSPRRGYDRRSPSPYGRERASPDYGRGPSPKRDRAGLEGKESMSPGEIRDSRPGKFERYNREESPTSSPGRDDGYTSGSPPVRERSRS